MVQTPGQARRRLRTAGIVVAVSITLLSACGGSDSASSASDTSSSTQSSAAPAKAPTVRQTTDAPRSEGIVGARVDVTDLSCAPGDGVWTVSGTVTNPVQTAQDYRIFTSFLDDARDTVGLLQTDVKGVGAGAAQPWSGELPISGTNLQCVLRVERTDAGT